MIYVLAYLGIGLLCAVLARLEQRGPMELSFWFIGLVLWPAVIGLLTGLMIAYWWRRLICVLDRYEL